MNTIQVEGKPQGKLHTVKSAALIVALVIGGVAIATGASLVYAKFVAPSDRADAPKLAANASAASAAGNSGASMERDFAKAAAMVNDQVISEGEVAMQTGPAGSRAVAVDQQINKALAAELARTHFPKDSERAIASAEREVLSQLYLSKRDSELRSLITPVEIKSFYDGQVKDENFASYRVRFFLSGDPAEVNQVAQQIAAGDIKSVDGKFKPAREKGEKADQFLAAGDLPYGLGDVVRQLKVGEFSRPLQTRSGLIILALDEIKSNPKPDMQTLTPKIKDVLVAQKLQSELLDARTKARIALK